MDRGGSVRGDIMTQEQSERASWLDGNAVAGPMHDLFGMDLTRARCTCDGCGRVAALADQRLYSAAPAPVLRCTDCDTVLLRYSTDHEQLRVDLTGTRLLVLPLRDPAA